MIGMGFLHSYNPDGAYLNPNSRMLRCMALFRNFSLSKIHLISVNCLYLQHEAY